ncbi:hypothetical protein BCR33DRAFT_790641 [Rhizoclosmatium globosum]|uniref:Uncharacterized protein n=1 Tax=Rhizoclosmatium globosum TaxID=329046 RepID=A0A1Y2BP91_9FUNG|nr:hypothetical protein BCR33DRAFT_790641 [Rhizoclosmatium globosum]|eukprot:ORY35965.1 hypothetical protein BCR33DRAFT_790641 [Rhizoclosmatium globosum]
MERKDIRSALKNSTSAFKSSTQDSLELSPLHVPGPVKLQNQTNLKSIAVVFQTEIRDKDLANGTDDDEEYEEQPSKPNSILEDSFPGNSEHGSRILLRADSSHEFYASTTRNFDSLGRSSLNSGPRIESRSNAIGKEGRTSSLASSLNTSIAVMSLLGEKAWNVLRSSSIYKFVVIAQKSTQIQIYATSAFNLSMILFIVAIILIIRNSTLPNIKFYNVIHATMGAIGKMAIISGFGLCQMIGKDYVANKLLNSEKGELLVDIAKKPSKFIPKDGIFLRYAYIVSLLSLEATIWYMLLKMKWTGVKSNIGSFPCIPAMYSSNHSLFPDLGSFLAGDSSLATIYNYGLPLLDGMIGGFSAWPAAAPNSMFDIEGLGTIFAFQVACSAPTLASKPVSRNTVAVELLHSSLGANDYNATISFQVSAYSHNVIENRNQDLIQVCDVKYVIGEGNIRTTFVADEWFMQTGGQVNEIQLSNNLVITQGMNYAVGYDAPSLNVRITQILSNKSGGTVALFHWAQDENQVHNVNQTWRGITGAIGAMSHFVLMQYNGSTKGECVYSAVKDHGIIGMPSDASLSILGSSAICFVFHLLQRLFDTEFPIAVAVLFAKNDDVTYQGYRQSKSF